MKLNELKNLNIMQEKAQTNVRLLEKYVHFYALNILNKTVIFMIYIKKYDFKIISLHG